MKAETAEGLTELALQMSDDLNGMVRDLEATESADEIARLRQAIGRVMWAIYFEILKPTYEEHPWVEPEPLTKARPAPAIGSGPRAARSAVHPAQPSAPASRRPPHARGSAGRRRLR